jgi:hypothetical protein
MRMTASEAEAHQRRIRSARLGLPVLPTRTQTKYRAVRTEVDGRSFASKFEAERYGQLKQLASAGQISELELQPRFPLRVEGVHVATYVADFSYIDVNTSKVIEDVKGFRTREYSMKRRLFEALYRPLTITEITRKKK